MRAAARVVAVPDPGGGTRLAVLSGSPPLLPRRTGDSGAAGSGTAEAAVHLVGGAAGPLGGDDLRIDVVVADGARLCVRTVAASVALPGRSGTASRLVVRATVGPGAALRWLPEPLIGAAGCCHDTVAEVNVATGGALIWREELVCGRHGEEPGDVRFDLHLRYAERTLLRQQLAVGPRAPGWSGAAVLGDARALGSVLVVDPGRESPPSGVLGSHGAVLPLAGPAVLATAVGTDLRHVRAALAPLNLDDVCANSGHKSSRSAGQTP